MVRVLLGETRPIWTSGAITANGPAGVTAGDADAAAISDFFQKGNPKFRKSIGPPIITAKSGRCINDLYPHIF